MAGYPDVGTSHVECVYTAMYSANATWPVADIRTSINLRPKGTRDEKQMILKSKENNHSDDSPNLDTVPLRRAQAGFGPCSALIYRPLVAF